MLDMICWCPRFSEVLPLPCSPMPPPPPNPRRFYAAPQWPRNNPEIPVGREGSKGP